MRLQKTSSLDVIGHVGTESWMERPHAPICRPKKDPQRVAIRSIKKSRNAGRWFDMNTEFGRRGIANHTFAQGSGMKPVVQQPSYQTAIVRLPAFR
ncbi:hypothetical protein D9M68_129220 [compost metagenome]